MGKPSHLGHMDRVAATMPSQAHAGAAQKAPDLGQWEGQDVPLIRPSSCNVKGGIPSSRRYLPTYLESTSEPTSPVGKPVLHMQPMHTGEPVARSPDALARPASNNMPLSEHDTQVLRRLLYLKAEGIERQERLQYLRQT